MKKISFATACILALALSACSNPSSDKPSTTAAPSLSDYKIAPVEARSSTAQPYGTPVASTLSRKQIYFDGLGYGSSALPQLLDYKANTASVLFTGDNSDWTKNPHASTAARLGADGKESIVSVVFTPKSTALSQGDNQGTVSVIVWNGTKQSIYDPLKGAAFDLYLCGWGSLVAQANNELSLASGDLTGDGKDELGFCVGNRFIILDGRLTTVLYDGWATGSGSADTDIATMHPSRVAAGDIKGDGAVEFITTYGSAKTNAVGSYKIYGGSTPTQIATGTLAGGSCPLGLMYANVALGDIDADGRKEVVFAGRQDLSANPCNVVAALWDATSSNLVFLSKGYSISVAGGDWAYNPIPPLVAFNPKLGTVSSKDEKSSDILLAWDTVLAYEAGEFTLGYKGLTTIARPVYADVAVADINYDNQDELISLSSVGGVGFEVYSLGTGNSFTRTTIPATVGSYMSLCTADLSGQSLVLQYLGTSVKYTNPQLVAVLASPPYYKAYESAASLGNCSTSFGKSTGGGSGSANSFTLSASFSVGVNDDCPLWGTAAEEEVKYTLGASFTYGYQSEREVIYSHVYSTMAGSDAVIYSCIPFDVYSYKVLSSPNAEAVGTTVTVDIPREPQIVSMERSLFNALPGNTLAIGSSILSHSIGDPYSYPNYKAIKDACANGGGIYDVTGTTSPSGDGLFNSSVVSVSSSNSTTVGGGLSVTASVQVTVLGCLFGAEAGFSDDFEYSVTTTESTEISGVVPGSGEATPFGFGIAGYNLTIPSLQAAPFMVVTYWVGKRDL